MRASCFTAGRLSKARRPVGLLGAPVPIGQARFGAGLVAAIIALALYLPLFGLTLVLVVLFETVARRWLHGPARWLGLQSARSI